MFSSSSATSRGLGGASSSVSAASMPLPLAVRWQWVIVLYDLGEDGVLVGQVMAHIGFRANGAIVPHGSQEERRPGERWESYYEVDAALLPSSPRIFRYMPDGSLLEMMRDYPSGGLPPQPPSERCAPPRRHLRSSGGRR